MKTNHYWLQLTRSRNLQYLLFVFKIIICLFTAYNIYRRSPKASDLIYCAREGKSDLKNNYRNKVKFLIHLISISFAFHKTCKTSRHSNATTPTVFSGTSNQFLSAPLAVKSQPIRRGGRTSYLLLQRRDQRHGLLQHAQLSLRLIWVQVKRYHAA